MILFKKLPFFTILTLSGLAVMIYAADPSEVIAKVGDTALTEAQMREEAGFQIYQAENGVYMAKTAWANQKARDILFDKAAKDAGLSRQAWEAKILKADAPTEPEVDEMVRRMAPPNQMPTDPAKLAPMRQRAVDYLKGQKKSQKENEIYQTLVQKTPIQIMVTAPTPPAIKLPPHVPIKGPAAAKVTVIEFTDFECPWCKRSQPDVVAMEKLYGPQIRFVDRMFPLQMHPRALPAAEAAYCAKEQDKFWEFREKLFDSSPKLEDADFKRIAKEVGLKEAKFARCLQNHTYRNLVDKDLADGQAYGVRGTPAFLVNGAQVSFQQLSETVKNELAKTK